MSPASAAGGRRFPQSPGGGRRSPQSPGGGWLAALGLPARRSSGRAAPGASLSPERVREVSLAGLIVLALVLFNFAIDNYISARFFNRVTISVAIIALMAAGQAVVIIARQIDLSVGSIVGVSAYVTGDVLTNHLGLSPVVAVLVAMALGTGLGLVNGVLVAYARVPAIIVTLGTLALFRAVLVNIAGGTTLTTNALPDWIVNLPRSTLARAGDFDLRVMFVFALVAAVVLQVLMGRLRWGRRLYAIGSNPDAAASAGLPKARLTLSAFVVCGALSGLAGFMFLGQFGTVNVTAGYTLELAAIAAAVVGGVSIQGGSGTIIGAFLGAILIQILNLSLVRVPQISEFWRDAILGALILAAVVLDVIVNDRFRRRLRLAAARFRAEATGAGPPGAAEATEAIGVAAPAAAGDPAPAAQAAHVAEATPAAAEPAPTPTGAPDA